VILRRPLHQARWPTDASIPRRAAHGGSRAFPELYQRVDLPDRRPGRLFDGHVIRQGVPTALRLNSPRLPRIPAKPRERTARRGGGPGNRTGGQAHFVILTHWPAPHHPSVSPAGRKQRSFLFSGAGVPYGTGFTRPLNARKHWIYWPFRLIPTPHSY